MFVCLVLFLCVQQGKIVVFFLAKFKYSLKIFEYSLHRNVAKKIKLVVCNNFNMN